MSSPALIDRLAETPFLEGLDPEHLAALAGLARPREFPAGATVFRDGEEAKNAYVLLSGRVSLEICAAGIGCRTILTVGAGELLGWSPLVRGAKLTATARTLAPSELVEFEAEPLLALCDREPALGYALLQRVAAALAGRLAATRVQLLDVYGGETTPANP